MTYTTSNGLQRRRPNAHETLIENEEKENTVEKSQSFTWIEYPRLGTSLSSGRWMASIEIGTTLKTDVLELDAGQWYWPDGSRLGDRETVVAVAQVPAPYRPEHDTQPACVATIKAMLAATPEAKP